MKRLIMVLLLGLMVFAVNSTALAACGMDDLYIDSHKEGSKTMVHVNPYVWAVQCSDNEIARFARASATVFGGTIFYFVNFQDTSTVMGTYINGILTNNLK